VRRLPELAPALVRYIHAVHFHLAPLTCEKRLRRRVAAGLAASINAQGGRVAALTDEGVRYRPRLPHEEPVFVSCSATVAIHGLPGQFEASIEPRGKVIEYDSRGQRVGDAPPFTGCATRATVLNPAAGECCPMPRRRS